MKVCCYSDLHTEFYDGNIERVLRYEDFQDADLVVFAGDCANFSQITSIKDWLKRSGKEFIYIPGNHEFYGRTFEDLEKATIENNSIIRIKDRVIVTSILWSYIPSKYEETIQRGIADFTRIRGFTVSKQNQINQECREFLKKALTDFKVDLVITHHAPSFKSVVPRWKDSPLNVAFANKGLEEIIKTNGPKFWVHGHMHDSVRYKIKDTVVLANPYGYMQIEVNPLFNRRLNIEV